MPLIFPDGFLWGAVYLRLPDRRRTYRRWQGAIHLGCVCAQARENPPRRHGGTSPCNAYEPDQLEGDLDLMAALGLKSYIFSVQWPRIQPDGRGVANPKGLDYYKRLVDGLRRRGIVPALTIYHWELPQALQERGGVAGAGTRWRGFVDYATILHDALAAQVPLWITQNEPHTSAWLGYGYGKHAPGVGGRQERADGGASPLAFARAGYPGVAGTGWRDDPLRPGAGGWTPTRPRVAGSCRRPRGGEDIRRRAEPPVSRSDFQRRVPRRFAEAP